VDLVSEVLNDSHVLTSFSCGRPQLDQWLRNSALRVNKQGTGRTTVIHEGDGVVLGYYTLAANALHRDTLPKAETRSVPREIPAILLAKLALDQSLHRQGLGRDLLVEALTKCANAALLVGARFVVVDAIDKDAEAFYEKYGFKRIPGTEPVRLLRRLTDLTADLTDTL
jgi:GNAT superfamily N-acetyltransferase